jgi:hypothetical protein
LSEAPGIGPQISSPQWLPCIKLTLASQFYNIYPLLNLLRLPRTSGLYRFEVGNILPTSSQDLASKRAPDLPKMTKISQKQAKISIKNYNIKLKTQIGTKIGHNPLFSAPGHAWVSAMWLRDGLVRSGSFESRSWSCGIGPYGHTLTLHAPYGFYLPVVSPWSVGAGPRRLGLIPNPWPLVKHIQFCQITNKPHHGSPSG